jgi:ketosteroid isomerase-like protein
MIGALLFKIGARRGWTRLEALDADFFIGRLADDVVLECPGHTTLSGRFVGRQAVADWYRRYFGRLEALQVRVLRMAVEHQFAVGLSNTIISEYEEVATLRGGMTLRGRAIDVTEIRRGKTTASRTYIFDLRAFDAAFGADATVDARSPAAAEIAVPVT